MRKANLEQMDKLRNEEKRENQAIMVSTGAGDSRDPKGRQEITEFPAHRDPKDKRETALLASKDPQGWMATRVDLDVAVDADYQDCPDKRGSKEF